MTGCESKHGSAGTVRGCTDSSRRWLLEGRRPYLQHSHLLPVAKQSERQGVFGVQARDDLAATERNGDDVGLQIGPVLVEHELVILESAPALPPAAVGEHIQVACGGQKENFQPPGQDRLKNPGW